MCLNAKKEDEEVMIRKYDSNKFGEFYMNEQGIMPEMTAIIIAKETGRKKLETWMKK